LTATRAEWKLTLPGAAIYQEKQASRAQKENDR
jgi:hypothetical protein